MSSRVEGRCHPRLRKHGFWQFPLILVLASLSVLLNLHLHEFDSSHQPEKEQANFEWTKERKLTQSGTKNPPPKETSARTCPLPDISPVHSCLRQTTSNLTLHYPADVREHVLEIHSVMQGWIQNISPHCAPRFGNGRYCGPWVENHWIEYFMNATNSSCLSDTFGSYIPLLIPWVDIWFKGGYRPRYPPLFMEKLKSILRSDVAYVTVSQNDEGLPQEHGFPEMDNMLVMSAGGYGHVPIPLLKQREVLVEHKPMNRSWLLSDVGSLDHSPFRLRRRMHSHLEETANGSYAFYYGKEWRKTMLDSYTSLVPRGTGRTAYHLMEVLQTGLIPIHVYQDIPWVPYRRLYEQKLGYLTTVEGLPDLLKQLRNMTADDFRQREAQIESYRESHLTTEGIMHQIEAFMSTGGGDLECGPKIKDVKN